MRAQASPQDEQIRTGDGGLTDFASSMRFVELAKVALEQQKLEFENLCHADLTKEHAEEEEQHAADLEVNAKNYMDRLKAILNFAVTSIRSATQNASKVQYTTDF